MTPHDILARLRAAVRAPDPVPFDELTQLAADVGEWLAAIDADPYALRAAPNADRAEDVLRLLDAALRPGDWRTSRDLEHACRAVMSGRSLVLDVITISNRAREYFGLLDEIGDAAGCSEFHRIAEHIRAQKETDRA